MFSCVEHPYPFWVQYPWHSKIINFEHPHPKAVISLHKKSIQSFPAPCQLSSLQHCKCAARILILCGWALQGYSAVGHCRDTLWLGTAGILGGWALQGYFAVGQCKDTLRLGTAGILCGWALQGYLVVGHCRDTWWFGTAGIRGCWSRKSASSLTTPQRGWGKMHILTVLIYQVPKVLGTCRVMQDLVASAKP